VTAARARVSKRLAQAGRGSQAGDPLGGSTAATKRPARRPRLAIDPEGCENSDRGIDQGFRGAIRRGWFQTFRFPQAPVFATFSGDKVAWLGASLV
jgi:hypothetical protein